MTHSLKKKMTILAAAGALAIFAAPGTASAEYGGTGYGGGSSFGSSAGTGSSSNGGSTLAFTGVDSGDLALAGSILLGSGIVVSTTLQRRRVEA